MLLAGISDRSWALDPLPASVRVSIHTEVGWTLHAGMQGGMTVGFLATIPSSGVPGHTFSIVWMSKVGDGTWAWEGINAASLGHAASAIEARYGASVLFDQPEIRAAVNALASSGTSDSGGVTITPMANGLALDDPFQAVAATLQPQTMEALVGFVAVGAVSLSAAVVDQGDTCGAVNANSVAPGSPPLFDRRLSGAAWRVEQMAAAAVNPDFTPDEPQGLWFCFPGTYCRDSSAIACGPGRPWLAGTCIYSCVDIVTTACAYIDACCTVWPATITTTTSAPRNVLKFATAAGTCP